LPSIGRTAVREWLLTEGVGDGYVVDASAVERVMDVARLERVAAEVAGGWRVARTAGRLRLEAPVARRNRSSSGLVAPGEAE